MRTLAVQLYDLTGTHTEFKWNNEVEEAFINLKSKLADITGIYFPNFNKKFILQTDASDKGLGSILKQEDERGNIYPVKLASRKPLPTKRRYSITEKDMFAVAWGIKNFDYYLRGRKFHLITDHKALTSIKSKGDF